ncbi:MAG TPA: Na+/H+ antiporter subunit E [Kiloniellales bacterium]|jgi:multicomponent K+:H+ antiporter subunit E|nr:Na+/H+ antiporter subunit E [Kiloniellales bacterium]
MLRRWLPFPLLTAALILTWLLLNESLSPGAILLGTLLALIVSRLVVRFEIPRSRIIRPISALKLACNVLVEIVRSNNAVARIILMPNKRYRSGFVLIPLDMRNPYGLTLLACIITATPGTLWVEFDSKEHAMLLHVLDLIDEDEWRRIIKERYEKRLMEIFE